MRLAHLALSQTYEHGEIISTSPSFEGMCMEDGRVLLTFKNVGGGWMDIDKNSVLQNFELSDGKHWSMDVMFSIRHRIYHLGMVM